MLKIKQRRNSAARKLSLCPLIMPYFSIHTEIRKAEKHENTKWHELSVHLCLYSYPLSWLF